MSFTYFAGVSVRLRCVFRLIMRWMTMYFIVFLFLITFISTCNTRPIDGKIDTRPISFDQTNAKNETSALVLKESKNSTRNQSLTLEEAYMEIRLKPMGWFFGRQKQLHGDGGGGVDIGGDIGGDVGSVDLISFDDDGGGQDGIRYGGGPHHREMDDRPPKPPPPNYGHGNSNFKPHGNDDDPGYWDDRKIPPPIEPFGRDHHDNYEALEMKHEDDGSRLGTKEDLKPPPKPSYPRPEPEVREGAKEEFDDKTHKKEEELLERRHDQEQDKDEHSARRTAMKHGHDYDHMDPNERRRMDMDASRTSRQGYGHDSRANWGNQHYHEDYGVPKGYGGYDPYGRYGGGWVHDRTGRKSPGILSFAKLAMHSTSRIIGGLNSYHAMVRQYERKDGRHKLPKEPEIDMRGRSNPPNETPALSIFGMNTGASLIFVFVVVLFVVGVPCMYMVCEKRSRRGRGRARSESDSDSDSDVTRRSRRKRRRFRMPRFIRRRRKDRRRRRRDYSRTSIGTTEATSARTAPTRTAATSAKASSGTSTKEPSVDTSPKAITAMSMAAASAATTTKAPSVATSPKAATKANSTKATTEAESTKDTSAAESTQASIVAKFTKAKTVAKSPRAKIVAKSPKAKIAVKFTKAKIATKSLKAKFATKSPKTKIKAKSPKVKIAISDESSATSTAPKKGPKAKPKKKK